MSNKETSFDFDDVVGTTTRKAPIKKKAEIPSNNKKDIVITLPGKTPGTYLFKDISECTGAEFKHWAARVYPDVSGLKESELEKLSIRMSVFKQILSYHTSCIFHTGELNRSTQNFSN